MAHARRDVRTVPVPEEIRELVRARLHELGPRAAAAQSNIGRTALFAIVAGEPVLPGTLALVRETAPKAA